MLQAGSCNEDGTASSIWPRVARAVLPKQPDADDSTPPGPLALQHSAEAVQQVGQRGFRYRRGFKCAVGPPSGAL